MKISKTVKRATTAIIAINDRHHINRIKIGDAPPKCCQLNKLQQIVRE